MRNSITAFVLVGLAVNIYVGVQGVPLATSVSQTETRQILDIKPVEIPDFISTDPAYRIDCSPDEDEYRSFCQQNLSKNRTSNITSASCTARGCIYDSNAISGTPTCYIPLEKGGYELKEGPNQISNAVTQYKLARLSTPSSKFSMFNHDIENLKVQVSVSGPEMIRMTIRDDNAERYEVPVPIQWSPSVPPTSAPPKIQFQMTKTVNEQVGFRVYRTDTQSILFDTTFFSNGFIYDDNFLQIVTTIPSKNAYGFGENGHNSFQHILKGSQRYGIFARDQWTLGENENSYGTHPFYMVIEPNGQTFGVWIFNSNAQDYKFDQFDVDKAMLTYRTIGGILDIFFFAGSTPEMVIRQYQSVIGKPYFPPYWAFGFQLCRYGYDTLDNMKTAMHRTLNASIPIDVHYGDIDYFHNRLDFTFDPINFKDIPEYIDWLHANGMKFITMLDPAIDTEAKDYPVYTEGQKADIWMKWPERRNLQFHETNDRKILGYVWPDGKTAFPDFFYPPTSDWWRTQILEYHNKIKFDGIWIDMNEPANFDTNKGTPWNYVYNHNGNNVTWNLTCPIEDEILENPPYKTAICGDYISDKTLCMIAELTDGKGKIYNHYDVHNLYGWSETVATVPVSRALDNKRSIVISRSTFATSGSISGHWLGDNTADWKHLKYNIIGMLEMNLFGIPYVGADICGFFANTTEQMCQRWMQLGAFNPFFRNHNGYKYGNDGPKFIDQDPGVFQESVVTSNRHAVELRYTLIPYLYTLFHRVHVSGGTVVRSMAHVFPTIAECWALDEQFLWDTSLLIAPVIYENHVNKSVYLPTTERWFDYYTGEEIKTLGQLTVPAPLDFIPLYLRGGAIIPHQQSAMNTVASRKKPLFLIVALDKNQYAEGNLFFDDGESIDTYERSVYNYFIFNYNSQRLTIEPWTYNYPQMGNDIKLEDITIYGMDKAPTKVMWNGQDLIMSTQWTFDSTKNILRMTKLELNVAKIHKFNFV
ncbi:unnamed protein product [Adineta steineri]|uniref:Maltase n=1 Tax=Adineta steineri TaxID=433720 RepID=A0A813X1W9_9BILA|nr:unnamed protein product [Adineta steineri]